MLLWTMMEYLCHIYNAGIYSDYEFINDQEFWNIYQNKNDISYMEFKLHYKSIVINW